MDIVVEYYFYFYSYSYSYKQTKYIFQFQGSEHGLNANQNIMCTRIPCPIDKDRVISVDA